MLTIYFQSHGRKQKIYIKKNHWSELVLLNCIPHIVELYMWWGKYIVYSTDIQDQYCINLMLRTNKKVVTGKTGFAEQSIGQYFSQSTNYNVPDLNTSPLK